MENIMDMEKQIEFDKIKEKWIRLCVTDGAKEKVKDMSFYMSEIELRKQMRDNTDGRNLIDKL